MTRAVLSGISVATFASPRLMAMLARPAAMAIPPSAALAAASAAPAATPAWPVWCRSLRDRRNPRKSWAVSACRTIFSAPMMADAICYPCGMFELAMIAGLLVALLGPAVIMAWYALICIVAFCIGDRSKSDP